ncbi:MAG: iron ABC transporter permease [Nitrospirae bacterium]|nr:iron ABC transporter permease [Nitrospirota bacterium]
MRSKLFKRVSIVLFLLLILLAVSLLSLSLGPAGMSLKKAVQVVSGGRGTAYYSIIVDIRLPRIALGFAVGGTLSLVGVILQGLFRNPLVEPYTLGISGGAALGISVTTLLGLTRFLGLYSLPLSGFAGAFCVILFLRFLTTARGILSVQGLLLAGVMINFISSSLVMLIMSISRLEDLHSIIFWMIGSLGETDWPPVRLLLVVAVAALLVSHVFCPDLNALSLGEEEALHLGIDVERTKKRLFVLTSVLTGLCVSLTGAIGFVGLVVPHFTRMFAGADHRILLVSSFLSGAIFLIFCDTVARTVALPIELPVGVVTGILGGILFIYALTRQQTTIGGE